MKTEKLKPEKLMVGDWVYDPIEKKNRKVTGLTLGHIRLFNGNFRTRTYEPIPINPEILRKNGLHCDDDGIYTYGCEYLIKIEHFEYENDDKIWDINIELDGNNNMRIHLRIKYVHELQHLLREAKIEKEITL